MKLFSAAGVAALVIAFTFTGCSHMPGMSDWTTLIDGERGLDGFDRIGDANWRAADGAIVADKAKETSYLVTRTTYKDFQIRAEFWADHTTNSGIFIRLSDPKKVGAANSYEVNIYDQRPEPSYGTGAIVDVAKVSPMPKAGGKWNTFLITAKGTNLVVELNGVQTVNVQDSKFASGPFALQFGNGPKDAPGGVIKWRKVQVRPL
jgi:3-keto-disaccharide hydrolase